MDDASVTEESQSASRTACPGRRTPSAICCSSKATPAVISHCFTHLNVHRIEARIEPENLSSRRLAAKLGFTEEGTLRDWLCVAGEFRSVVMYSLLRAESKTRPFQQRSRPC